jgi:hypothetical protein
MDKEEERASRQRRGLARAHARIRRERVNAGLARSSGASYTPMVADVKLSRFPAREAMDKEEERAPLNAVV